MKTTAPCGFSRQTKTHAAVAEPDKRSRRSRAPLSRGRGAGGTAAPCPPLPTGGGGRGAGATREPSGQPRRGVRAGGRGRLPAAAGQGRGAVGVGGGSGLPREPPASLQVGPQVGFRAWAGRLGKLRLSVGDKGRERWRGGGGGNWGEGGERREGEEAGGAQRRTPRPGFPEPGPPVHKAARRVLAALPPKKKPQPLNPMNYRSPLSVAGPGRGQGPGEAGGEGLRAGCTKARVKFRASPGRTGKGRGGALLTATAAAAPSPGAPEERRPCPEGAGLPLLPHVRRFGLGKGWGGGGGAAPRIPAIGEITGSEGRDKGEPSSGALLAGRGRARRGGGRCPWAGLPLRPRARGERIWAAGGWWGLAGLAPRLVFRLRGGRRDKEGSSQLRFPRTSPRGRRHMPMILINIFWRNIITEHKLGFNSRLITRGACRVRGAGRAGRGAAAGEAPSPLHI